MDIYPICKNMEDNKKLDGKIVILIGIYCCNTDERKSGKIFREL